MIETSMSLHASGPVWTFNFDQFSSGFMDQVGEAMVETLQEYAPVKTGQLRESFSYRKESTMDTFYLGFYSDDPNVEYVIHGTAPHTILPVNVTALTIGDTFAASAEHPGSQPNDFVNKAFDAMFDSIDPMFYESVSKNIKP